MLDELQAQLDELAIDLENKHLRDSNVTGKCVKVLNTYVRPAVRLAYEKLKHDRITYGEGEEPFLSVRSPRPVAELLRFRCDGEKLEILTVRLGSPHSYPIPIDSVTDSLVAGIIIEFLRSSLGVSARPSAAPPPSRASG
jgi:hypothetical protein